MDWTPAKADGTTLSLGTAEGRGGSALRISYDLKNTRQWVAASKGVDLGDFRNKALSFWIKGKGAANMFEIKLVDEDDSNYGVKKAGVTSNGDWARVVLNEADFTYWWGGDKKLGPVKNIYFAISAGDGGAGEVLVSDLRLGTANPDGQIAPDGTVADGKTTDGWIPAFGAGASGSLALGEGKKGKAVVFKYNVPAEQWVSIRRTLNADLSKGNPKLVLHVRGEGDPLNLEVKVVDRDESNFGKVFEGLTGNTTWQEIVLPLADLQYQWGGDSRLDASLIRYLDLAVAGVGGEGKLYINDIKIVR
jgi:hypothetical protein